MDLVSRIFGSQRIVVPIAIGIVALLLGGVFAFITFRGDDEVPVADEPSASEIDSRSFVSKRGGFALDVPTDLEASRKGRTATFAADDRSLVVTVGPGEPGRLRPASKQFLRTLRKGYEGYRLLGTEEQLVDGRPALASYGQATNAEDVKTRFAVVVVRDQPQNYTITAFTALGSDPDAVLPRVNTMVNSFEVLP